MLMSVISVINYLLHRQDSIIVKRTIILTPFLLQLTIVQFLKYEMLQFEKNFFNM